MYSYLDLISALTLQIEVPASPCCNRRQCHRGKRAMFACKSFLLLLFRDICGVCILLRMFIRARCRRDRKRPWAAVVRKVRTVEPAVPVTTSVPPGNDHLLALQCPISILIRASFHPSRHRAAVSSTVPSALAVGSTVGALSTAWRPTRTSHRTRMVSPHQSRHRAWA